MNQIQNSPRIVNHVKIQDIGDTTCLAHTPEVGQEFSSFKEFCHFLESEDSLKGNQRICQITEIKRYIDWVQQGYRIIITKVYDRPLPRIENRGGYYLYGQKGLTDYQLLFNTILLYFFKYAKLRTKEDGIPCLSVSATELKKDYFLLINPDYYNVRKLYSLPDICKATGLDPQAIQFIDNKITKKVCDLIKTGMSRLEKENIAYVSRRYYIYYYNTDGELRARAATDEEMQLILDAGYEAREEFEEDVMAIKDEEFYSFTDPDSKGKSKEYGVTGVQEKTKAINAIQMDKLNRCLNMLKDDDGFSETDNLFILKNRKNHHDYSNEVKWVNIVNKYQIFTISDHLLTRELTRRQDILKTLPQAQISLNNFIMNWVDESLKTQEMWDKFKVAFPANRLGELEFNEKVDNFSESFVSVKNKKFKNAPGLEALSFIPAHNMVDDTEVWIHLTSINIVFNYNDNAFGGAVRKKDVVCFVDSMIRDMSHLVITNIPALIKRIQDYFADKEDTWTIRGYMGGIVYNEPKDIYETCQNEDCCFAIQFDKINESEVKQIVLDYYNK